MEILCFWAGIAVVYTQSNYPVLILMVSQFLSANRLVFVWFFLAILWGYLHLGWVNESGMPNARVLSKVALQGTVVSLPLQTASKTQFELAVTHLNHQKVRTVVLLSCYRHCPVFKIGQRWFIKAKLKKPENLANPGHYDWVS